MKTIISLVLSAACVPAHAGFLTGEHLLGLLNGPEPARNMGLAYLAGVHDSTDGEKHCAPQGLMMLELMERTKAMLEEVGSLRAMPANALVVKMMELTWPCDTKEPGAAPVKFPGKLHWT